MLHIIHCSMEHVGIRFYTSTDNHITEEQSNYCVVQLKLYLISTATKFKPVKFYSKFKPVKFYSIKIKYPSAFFKLMNMA